MVNRKRWNPARGPMTRFANACGIDVAVRQVVTTGTGTGAVDLRVIHREWRNPARGHVAGFADVRAVNVASR